MKITILPALFMSCILLLQLDSTAQDSTKRGAIKKINGTSEQTDRLYGKKIQQTNLSNGRVEHLDTEVVQPKKIEPVKKKKLQQG